MTPSAKECNPFDKECHIKVKRLMTYRPPTKKRKPPVKPPIDQDDVEPSDNSNVAYKFDDQVAFDQKKSAGGVAGNNVSGTSQYVKTGSRDYVNQDPNMVTKFGPLDERYNLKKKKTANKNYKPSGDIRLDSNSVNIR